jgi:hypothetical protein
MHAFVCFRTRTFGRSATPCGPGHIKRSAHLAGTLKRLGNPETRSKRFCTRCDRPAEAGAVPLPAPPPVGGHPGQRAAGGPSRPAAVVPARIGNRYEPPHRTAFSRYSESPPLRAPVPPVGTQRAMAARRRPLRKSRQATQTAPPRPTSSARASFGRHPRNLAWEASPQRHQVRPAASGGIAASRPHRRAGASAPSERPRPNDGLPTTPRAGARAPSGRGGTR